MEMIMKNSTEDQMIFVRVFEADQLIERLKKEIEELQQDNDDLREALHSEIYS